MSLFAIKTYYSEVEKLIHYGGSKNEMSIRSAFASLLNEFAKQRNLILVQELSISTAKGSNVIPDGILKDSLRLDWGYWESKDETDDIDEEIRKKFSKGYPKDNILFEDSVTVVLFQSGVEVQRVPMKDAAKLEHLIKTFINYERPEVATFRKAIDLFRIGNDLYSSFTHDTIS